jgi:ribosomal protein S18 acetylase RimI-like enzyme
MSAPSSAVLCRWATRWDREDLIAHVAELMRLHDAQPDRESLREALEFALKYPERVRFAVAQREDRLIGVTSLHDGYSTWRGRPYGDLQDVYIVAEERGTGAVEKLFEFIVAEGRRRGYCRLELHVREGNERARAFYEKMGMRWNSELVYSLELAPAGDES